MLDIKTFKSALEQLEEERKIPKEKILEAIEQAMAAAYKKDYGQRGQIIKAKLDSATGKFDIWQEKIVVNEDMIKSEEELEEEKQEQQKRGESQVHFCVNKNEPELKTKNETCQPAGVKSFGFALQAMNYS